MSTIQNCWYLIVADMLTSGYRLGLFESITTERLVVISMIICRGVMIEGRERCVTFVIWEFFFSLIETFYWDVRFRTLISSFLIQFPTQLLTLILLITVNATFFFGRTLRSQWWFWSFRLNIIECDIKSFLLVDCILVRILQMVFRSITEHDMNYL